PQDTALSIQRVLFQQFLFKAEAQEYCILVVEVLHHSRANAGICDVVHQPAPVKFLGIEQFQCLCPVLLRNHQHPVLGGAGVATVDGFRLSQQFTHTVGVDEAQLL
ncbi:RNA polymerase sigma factor, sigma-70 family, partial [Dysosmobacter welbionis]